MLTDHGGPGGVASTLSAPACGDGADPAAFLKARESSASYSVEHVPLRAMHNWRIGDRISHVSGRFFTVEGLSIHTNFGPSPAWHQPIIVQPEIGILGFITKRIDGIRHFLMQAKMEPGNSDLVQFAATVQATPSNYQRVHGGKPTPYLEYFLEQRGRGLVVDRLLSEHASWYLHKRNRNMIVEVGEDEDVPVYEDFVWLSLDQIGHELQLGRRVNMNARTVLSCITYSSATARPAGDDFAAAVVRSHCSRLSDDETLAALSWIFDQKSRYQLEVKRISLGDMDDWTYDELGIRNNQGRHFSILGLAIQATSREVATWFQPMLQPVPGGVVAFICQPRAGVLEFLVQAMVQPGSIDKLELAATIQLMPGNYAEPADRPALAEYLDSPEQWIRHDALQSEDGGRFYLADTRHVVIEVPEHHVVEAPPNYRWMSLGLMHKLTGFGYYVNVEARSLMACVL